MGKSLQADSFYGIFCNSLAQVNNSVHGVKVGQVYPSVASLSMVSEMSIV